MRLNILIKYISYNFLYFLIGKVDNYKLWKMGFRRYPSAANGPFTGFKMKKSSVFMLKRVFVQAQKTCMYDLLDGDNGWPRSVTVSY